jgi:hypothetical protein
MPKSFSMPHAIIVAQRLTFPTGFVEIQDAAGLAFKVRGLEAAKAEWNLVCLAVNLKRMHTLGWMPTT